MIKETLTRTKNQKIQNLRTFTKLYGYVKYFHPSDEASQIDWDKFAIYGAEKVINAKSSEELKAVIEKLFLLIAPTIQIYLKSESPKLILQMESAKGLTLVTWQHRGVGFEGNQHSTYRSVRLGRIDNSVRSGNDITRVIVGKNFRGKKFKLTAQVKADVKGTDDNGYLFLMTMNSKQGIFFDDNMRDRPIRLNEWKEYEISGKFIPTTLLMLFLIIS